MQLTERLAMKASSSFAPFAPAAVPSVRVSGIRLPAQPIDGQSGANEKNRNQIIISTMEPFYLACVSTLGCTIFIGSSPSDEALASYLLEHPKK